ncbi:MAG: endonuclease V [Thermoplasmatales archaeon]
MIDKPDIYEAFYNLVKQIPEGYISTYGDLAMQLGDIVASRAVGQMLSENEEPDTVPCYRVVMSDGRIGGYTHPMGISEKIRRLKSDGIPIVKGKVENLEKVRFTEFKSDFPLKRYNEQVKRLDISKLDGVTESLRAIDVSYKGRVGVGVAVDFGKEITFEVSIKKVRAPYIPNYLYLREGEIVESLLSKDKLNAIDGNGALHPLRRGLATVTGANTGKPTVGIAKKLLMGQIKGQNVYVNGEMVARMYGKYIISYGFGVPLEKALQMLINEGHFPQTKFADRLSRRYRDLVLPVENSVR